MPYKSEAQRGYMHAAKERGDIDPKVVEEFDEASRGQRDLPYHVKKKRPVQKAVVLVPLEKGQESFDFDEDSHPRAPKGGPHGGEFVSKETETFPVQYRRHGHPTPETRTVTVPPNADPERKTPAPVGGEIIEARGRKEADRINAALYNAYGYHAKIVHQHGGYILKDTGLDAETAHDLMFLLGSSIASKKVTQELIEGARAQRIAQAAENARRYDAMLASRESNAGRFAYKKEVPAGPIHHDAYTGPRHTYGLTNRPAGYSHIPEGWVVGSEKEHPDYRHGTVDYPRPLTEQEQRSYELETVHPHEEGGLSVKDMRHARAFAEDMARDGWTGQEKKDLDALQAAIDAGPRALAEFLQATQDTNDFSYTLAGNVTMKKAFPVLKTAPLPEDTALLSERSELGDSQGGPPPAKPFLIPHAKRPRRRTPNRQGGGGQVLHEEETDRTNLVLDPPVLIPFEKALPGKEKDGRQTPPKGYPEKRKQYGDPENYKYPLDTEEHVRAAWSYIHQSRNASKYSPEQVNAIKARIKRAGKPHSIAFEGAPLDKDLGLGP